MLAERAEDEEPQIVSEATEVGEVVEEVVDLVEAPGTVGEEGGEGPEDEAKARTEAGNEPSPPTAMVVVAASGLAPSRRVSATPSATPPSSQRQNQQLQLDRRSHCILLGRQNSSKRKPQSCRSRAKRSYLRTMIDS